MFALPYSVIDRIDEVQNIDLISCLNVLDRCANPHQLMHEIYRSLAPNGRVVVALVLPYCHYVETSMYYIFTDFVPIHTYMM